MRFEVSHITSCRPPRPSFPGARDFSFLVSEIPRASAAQDAQHANARLQCHCHVCSGGDPDPRSVWGLPELRPGTRARARSLQTARRRCGLLTGRRSSTCRNERPLRGPTAPDPRANAPFRSGGPGALTSRAPTDPDVRVSRIRLLRRWASLRDAGRREQPAAGSDEGIR